MKDILFIIGSESDKAAVEPGMNLIAEKNGSISDKKIVDSMMLGSYNKLYSGDVAIKKFKVSWRVMKVLH